ncbi:hypothetical protein [Streptomyces zaehneri]|uniref:hypothetical protein n=1 Tax=Streptomyces zaehneri TaxID=3051180 RepID=UPI0028D33513|nr:hypothetical protein [Streptomyces sp. DSM 40713]
MPRPATLAVTGGAVPQRVQALPAPPVERPALPFAPGALLLTLCCAGLADAASDSGNPVESAERARCAADAGALGAAWAGRPPQRPDVRCHHGGTDGHGRHRGWWV